MTFLKWHNYRNGPGVTKEKEQGEVRNRDKEAEESGCVWKWVTGRIHMGAEGILPYLYCISILFATFYYSSGTGWRTSGLAKKFQCFLCESTIILKWKFFSLKKSKIPSKVKTQIGISPPNLISWYHSLSEWYHCTSLNKSQAKQAPLTTQHPLSSVLNPSLIPAAFIS